MSKAQEIGRKLMTARRADDMRCILAYARIILVARGEISRENYRCLEALARARGGATVFVPLTRRAR